MAGSDLDDTSEATAPNGSGDSDDRALANASDDADRNAGNNDVDNTAVPCDTPSKSPGTLIVTVKDESGAAVADATVSVTGPVQKQGKSQADGTTKFEGLSEGTYNATASKDGYVPPKAPATAKVPSGGTAKSPVVLQKVVLEIEINNTSTATDDIVQLKCAVPAHRHKVSCQIRLKKAMPADVNVVLTNPDGKLRFPEDGDKTKALTLPANGGWTAFEISGEAASAAIGDASIEAHHNTDSGALVGSKPATVFWFDTKMSAKKGSNYAILDDGSGTKWWMTTPNNAVLFSADATIKPAGVDCTAPQLKDLRIGIMQNRKGGIITDDRWANPTITWDAGAKAGDSVTIPRTLQQTVVVKDDTNDSTNLVQPLYDQPNKPGNGGTMDSNSLNPPKGCASGAVSTSSDTPRMLAPLPLTQSANDSKGTKHGDATYQHTMSRMTHSFITWAVVFNVTTENFCCLREAVWSLDTDASKGGTQAATADGTDRAPTITPITTPFFNDEANDRTNYHSTKGPNVTITFPKTTP